MHYNSIEHFLTAQRESILALLLTAWREVGGYYATQPPAALAAQVAEMGEQVFRVLGQGVLDRPHAAADAQNMAARGVPLKELRQATEKFDAKLRALAAQELAEQPELRQELERRVKNMGTRFRSTVTAVELDAQIQQLTQPPPKK